MGLILERQPLRKLYQKSFLHLAKRQNKYDEMNSFGEHNMALNKNIILELKQAILNSRYHAARLVNKELIVLYFGIGKKISETATKESWGSKVLEQISAELQNELPGLRGFSGGNLKKMRVFADFWKPHLIFSSALPNQLLNSSNEFSSALPNQLPDNFTNIFFSVSFTHQFSIASKCQTFDEAFYYLSKVAVEFWNYRHLEKQIEGNLYKQQGTLPNNFSNTLPENHFEKALKTFKDEYMLDFINIQADEGDDERILEREIVINIKKFILSIGNDFAFIGNQYRLIVEEQEYFIDLLFFNRKLQCLVAFDLKTGKFKPEYLGKMNFYLSALDDLIKQPHENPSIGIILCKEKNNKIVEYSFRDFNKAMGVATYKTSDELPEKFKDVLPDSETLKKLLD
jgi:predicted nuclease of restriction endonuclease-like (RecB) superfamily